MFQYFKDKKEGFVEYPEYSEAARQKKEPVQPAPDPVIEKKEAVTVPKVFLRTDLKVDLHQKLLGLVNLSALEKMDRASISRDLSPILRELLEQERIALNAQEYG